MAAAGQIGLSSGANVPGSIYPDGTVVGSPEWQATYAQGQTPANTNQGQTPTGSNQGSGVSLAGFPGSGAGAGGASVPQEIPDYLRMQAINYNLPQQYYRAPGAGDIMAQSTAQNFGQYFLPSREADQRMAELRDRITPQQFYMGSPIQQRMEGIATGAMPTAAEMAGKAQQQQIAQNIMAQTARAGAYNPANVRAGINATSSLGQNMAAQTQAAASQEAQGVLQAAMAGRLQAGQQQFGQEMAKWQFDEQLRQAAIGERERTYGALLDRESLSAGIAPSAMAAAAQRGSANTAATADLVGNIFGAAGGALTSLIPFLGD